MAGLGEGFALGILSGLVVEVIKEVGNLVKDLKNMDKDLEALALQMEQKNPMLKDIETLCKSDLFGKKIQSHDRQVLGDSLRHIWWQLEQINQLNIVATPGGSTDDSKDLKDAALSEPNSAAIAAPNTVEPQTKSKRFGILPRRNKGKENESNSTPIQPAPLSATPAPHNKLKEPLVLMRKAWNKPTLIKLVGDVRVWVDDLEKFAINVFAPIMHDIASNQLDEVSELFSNRNIGLPPLKIALNILLTFTDSEYRNAEGKKMEIAYKLINPLADATADLTWVTYEGREHIVVYKSGPIGDDQRTVLTGLGKEVQLLALSLRDAHKFPGLHVLKSPGYFWDNQNTRYGVLFSPPENADKPTSTQSLASHFASDERSLARDLSNRFKLARALANSMFHFHSIGWLHKGFRANNIFVFNERKDRHDIPRIEWSSPYVLGFETSRGEQQLSGGVIPEDEKRWQVRLYQHPARLEQNKTPSFAKIHDIYSLGVLLLEVGRMESLATEAYKARFDALTAVEVRQEFLKLAGELVTVMGPAYCEVVEKCLLSRFQIDARAPDYDQQLLSAFKAQVCEKLEFIKV